jgi:hypothetical protein
MGERKETSLERINLTEKVRFFLNLKLFRIICDKWPEAVFLVLCDTPMNEL